MTAEFLASDAPKLWTLPAGADFLGELAHILAKETDLKNRPDALADALIYVPNRRSARALALALYRAGGQKPFLPPDIRALGDLESDEPPTGTEEAIAGLGPALTPGARLGALASLVMKFYNAQGLTLPARSALSAAEELARLLDQAALSDDVDWQLLPDLVANADLAHHWERSVQFLKIVSEAWPDWLAERGATDPLARRLAVAEAIGAHWRSQNHEGLTLIAGSTGSTPASRALMQSVQNLPRGRIIFPGLDRDAAPHIWPLLADTPDHPQHALAGTLTSLGRRPEEVAPWPKLRTPSDLTARRRLVQEALAPASATANWLSRLTEISPDEPAADFAKRALNGLSILTARDETDEALLAALMLRETLETAGQTAALVTPDASLARRVAAELKRWNITLHPSAGLPLWRTPAGQFLGLVVNWMIDPGDPVALCSLLKHPMTGADPDGLAALETDVLRGPRHWQDFAELCCHIRQADVLSDREALIQQITDLEHALQTLSKTGANQAHITGKQAAADIAYLAEGVAAQSELPWQGEDGAMCAKGLETLGDISQDLPPMTLTDIADMLTDLGAGLTVAPPANSHENLTIWGPLEARLQSADRLILAGLNEGVWPAKPAPDGFLPRRFRSDLGLDVPEARLGLAAHDFAQLASAPDVTILLSERRDDAPAVASRWIWRLRTLTEGALGKDTANTVLKPAPDRDPRPWAEALEAIQPSPPDPHLIPRPSPPVEARPKRLSVTRITQLQRDPYATYAEQILRLNRLDLLNAPLDPRRRGTAIHAALEALESTEPASTEHLLNLLEDTLHQAGENEEDILSVRASRQETARQYIDWRAHRIDDLAQPPWLEKRGEITLDIGGEPFTLSAHADRIELKQDGTLAIIDFKTGNPPSQREILSGLEQQMPLQALIAEQGGFNDIAHSVVSELLYVSFKADWKLTPVTGGRAVEGPETPQDFAALAKSGLEKLIGDYRKTDAVYLSAPRIQFRSQYAGDYDRLARRAEWAGDADDD